MGVGESGAEIFIVDDDLGVRQALRELLFSAGYQSRTFSDGEQAWRSIECGARPAAIVLDVWLPGMSGRQFVARLRSSEYAAIPVVVLSGAGWTERTECGADDALRKPVEGAAVVHAVDRLVKRGRGVHVPTRALASSPVRHAR